MQIWATFWVHHRVFFPTLIKETLHHLLYTYWDILTEKLFRCNVLRYSVRHKNDRASEIQQTFYSANKIQKSMWHPLQECDVRVSGMASYITPPHTTFRRLPHKIASNYGGYTASQWKNWTLIYSLFCLKDLLPERHIICWQKFVLACKLICSPIISKTDIVSAELLFVKFGQKFEQFYGKKFVTPNIHLPCHSKECVIECGPVHAFWCFSFERFNGILGSMQVNGRSIEVQIMRKLLAGRFVWGVTFSNEFLETFMPFFTPEKKMIVLKV